MTASCKIKLLRVLISALFIVFACNVQGNDQYEDKLISCIKDTNYAELIILPETSPYSTLYKAPDGVRPKDWKDIYYVCMPLSELRANGYGAYVEERVIVLMNNGQWVLFPQKSFFISNPIWRGQGRYGCDYIFEEAISISEVRLEGEAVYETDVWKQYDFRASIIKITLKNNSPRDIMLLHDAYIHSIKSEGEYLFYWDLEIDNQHHLLVGTSIDQENLYIPANGSTSISVCAIPHYTQRKYYQDRFNRPKQILDYRINKKRNCRLTLKFMTGLYGINVMRCRERPLIFRYEGKL